MARQDAISIGTLAKRSGVNIETIRYYERAGVLPAPPRSAGGYRLYRGADAERRLRFIRRARDLGLPLADVRRLLALSDQQPESCRRAQALASHHLADVRTRIADLRRIERVLAGLVNSCAKGKLSRCPLLETLARSTASSSDRGHAQ
jgi:MerR family mercuric resistance operon transcriptional regulator